MGKVDRSHIPVKEFAVATNAVHTHQEPLPLYPDDLQGLINSSLT